MDYQDASSSPATDSTSSGSAPIARPDVDALAPGSFGPASGNTISGSGTISGTAGADSLGDAPASIVSVQGAGGTASPASGSAQVAGQYGVLTIDPQGNFSYVRNGGTPDGVEDVFGYTLADRDGSTSSSTLTIQIGQTQSAALDGVVNLPAGVELSDIRVQGRDLIVTLPDGSTMLIPGGAVFVPQLVIGDTQVPASNVAALLINSEPPAPAAGSLQSSGGNFANPVPPLDPGVPLGDLIPPTELSFPQPEFEEIGQDIDEEPVAGIASAGLDDDEQSNGNPGGVGDDPFGATDSGFLPGSDGDGDLTWALLTTGAPTGFSYSAGPNGSVLVFQNGNPNAVLSITVNPATGAYTVTQLGVIAHPAGSDENNLIFPISYTVTDEDDDTAIGTLNVNVDDDTPIARDDTDALAAGQKSTDGNVITAVGTTSAPGSADSPGADGLGLPNVATDGVNGILAGTSGTFTAVGAAGVTINGQFGSLLINQNGSYVYTRFDSARQGGNDVFTYRIFDGDGDETTATLTITVPADPIPVPAAATAIVDDDGLVPGDQDDGAGDDVVPDNDGDGSQATFRGTLTANFGIDAPGTFNLSAMHGVEQVIGQETVRYSWNDATDTLTAEIINSPDASRVETDLFQVVLQPGGQFDVTLLQNVLHTDQGTPPAFENNETAVLTFTAVDSNNDTANGTLTITFDDDIPTALPPQPPEQPGGPTIPLVGGLVDEDDLAEGPPQNDNVTGNHDVQPGDDSPIDASGDADPTTTGGGAGSLAALFDPGADQPLTFSLSTVTTGLPALRSGGVLLTYNVVVNDVTGVSTLTASAGAETIFTLTVNEDGSWVFNLQGALDHAPPVGAAFENNIDIDFSALVLATDSDGDTVPGAAGAFVITVDDDIPTAKPPTPPTDPNGDPIPLITGLVDEDNLSPGNTPPDNSTGNQDQPAPSPGDDNPDNVDGDNDGTTVGTGKPSLTALFNAGADQPLTILLSLDTSGLEAQNLTSNGEDLAYDVDVDTGLLTGYVDSGTTPGVLDAGDRTIFTLSVDADTGNWEFDLVDQLDHSEPGTEDNILIDFSSVITAVDADGDPVTAAPGTFVINVDDDMPQPFEDCPDDVITVNEPGSTFTGDLNLPPVGADEPGVLTFGVSDGDPVLDNEGNPVTSGGTALVYFINDAGVLEARVGDETGDVIFTITLNPDGTTFTYDQLGTIDGAGGGIAFDDLTSAAAGNVDYRAVGENDPGTSVDLILSGSGAGGADEGVNTDSDSIGVDNQSMDLGETLRIDFVSNLQTAAVAAGTPMGLTYDGHVGTSSFIQTVPQVQGNQDQEVAFQVWALNTSDTQADEPDRNPAGGFDNSTITTITEVTVIGFDVGESTAITLDISGVAVGVWTDVAYGISVQKQADGSVIFTGVQQGDQYGISTGANTFNAVAVQSEPTGTGPVGNQSNQDSFDLGVFAIGAVDEGEPVDLTVPVVFTDADGDPVVCDIDIHLGLPLTTADIAVTVDEAGLPIIGSDAASNSETSGGNLQTVVSGGTGPYTFALAPGESLDGDYGTLTLNANGTFSYTLDTPFDTQPDADDGTNPELGKDTFQVVATDSLGATQTLTIKVNIIDDVPSANDDSDTVDNVTDLAEGNVITGAGTTEGTVNKDVPGADGFVSITGVVSDGTADSDTDATGGFTVTGDYGTLEMDANGEYTYTRDPGSPGAVTDSFTYTYVDGDGDTATATLTIEIDDSVPTLETPPPANLDDDVIPLFNGNVPDGIGDDDPDVVGENVVNGQLVGAGGDGGLDYFFSATQSGLPAGFTVGAASDVNTLIIVQNQGGNPVTVLTIELNNDTGAYTVTQNANIWHPAGNDENNVPNINVSFFAQDIDGSKSAPAILTINVDDDTPENNSVTLTAPTVHEDALAGGNSEGGQTVNASITVASILTLVSVGADQPGTVGLNAAIDGTNTGLTQGGLNIVWDVVSATQVRGLVNNDPAQVVFTLTRNGSQYDFVLLDNIDHDNDASLLTGEGDAFVENLSLANVFTVTDADSDTIIVNAGASINIQNDVPTNNSTTLTKPVVHEDALAGGNSEGGQTVNASITVAALASLVNAGADSPVTISLNAAIDGSNTGLTQGGVNIVWDVVSATQVRGLVGNNPANVAFTLTFDAVNSEWDFVLLDNIDHDNDASLLTGEGDAFVETLSLAGVFKATDTDGDSVIIDAGAAIDIQNDVPTNNAGTVSITVHEDALNNLASVGNSAGEGAKTVNGSFTVAQILGLANAGADSPVTVAFNDAIEGTNTGLTQGGVAIKWDYIDATHIRGLVNGDPTKVAFTLTRNGDNYDFELLDNIDNNNDGNLNTGEGDGDTDSLSLANVFVVTDTDGDKLVIDGGASVLIENDIPIIGTIDNGTANNDPNALHSFGDLNFVVGADEPATVTSITLTTTATSGNKAIVTNFDSTTGILTGYQSADNAGPYDPVNDTVVVFRLTVDPDGGTTGTWDFDLVTPLDTTTTPVDIGDSSSFGAGPTLGQILESAANAPLSVVSGYFTQDGFDYNTWKTGGGVNSVTVDPGGVNGSTVGWGIPNNSFNGENELMIFDFGDEALTDWDGSDAFAPPGSTSLPQISFATFDFFGYNGGVGNAGDDIAYVVHLVDADGNPAGILQGFVPDQYLDGSSHDAATNFKVEAPAGKFIADVQFFSGIDADGTTVQDLGQGKIALVTVGVNSTSINQNLTFNVELSDTDGDKVSGGFTINVANTNSPSTLMAFDDAMQRTSQSTFTMAMMGAVAAAGMTSPAYSVSFDDDDGSGKLVATVTSVGSDPGATDSSSVDASASLLSGDLSADPAIGYDDATDSGSPGDDQAADSGLSAEDAGADTQPANLDEGTDAPVAESSTSPFIAQDIMLPAEMLESGDAAGGGVQHNAIVGKVLVDALNGGGDGPSLDALVNALPGGTQGLEPVATLEPATVPMGDMADFAGFTTDHVMPILEQMAMHQDAGPAQA